MGIGYILIGIVFLFNPMVSFLDILPDFIGYLLILIGIYKIADMNTKMSNIHKQLLYLTGISILRMILSFVMTSDDGVLTLIFVFVFAITESYLLITVFNKIFEGFEDIGIRFENSNMYEKTSELRTLTYVFIIVRGLFTVIPELRHLSTTDYEGKISSYDMTGRADYSYMLILLNILVVTIIGLIWLCMMIKYLNRIRKDSELNIKMKEYYVNNVLIETKRFLLRRIFISMCLLMAGFIFIIDVFFENVDALPDFIGAIFILAAVIFMRKDNPNINKLIYAAIAYIPVSLVNWIYRVIFVGNEYHVKSLQYTDVLTNYIVLIAISFISSLLLVYIFYSVYKVFTRMINEMIGYEYEAHFATLIEQQKELISKKNRKNTSIFIISLLLAVSKVVQTSSILLFPEYWMAHFIIEMLWLFRMYLFITDLYDEVKFRLDVGVE